MRPKTDNPMVLIRVGQFLEEDVGFLQGTGHHHRLLVVDVVVYKKDELVYSYKKDSGLVFKGSRYFTSRSVNQKEFLRFKLGSFGGNVGILVPSGVIIRSGQSHVSLCVYCVVINPVGDGGNGNTAFEDVVFIRITGKDGQSYESLEKREQAYTNF